MKKEISDLLEKGLITLEEADYLDNDVKVSNTKNVSISFHNNVTNIDVSIPLFYARAFIKSSNITFDGVEVQDILKLIDSGKTGVLLDESNQSGYIKIMIK